MKLAAALRRVEASDEKARAEQRWAEAAAAELVRPPVPPELLAASQTTQEGTSTPRAVVVLWDLDNKKPYSAACPPRALAAALRAVGGRFGTVVDVQAFANRHAFTWTSPFQAAIDEAQREEDAVHMGCICPLCGRQCGDPDTLRTHFAKLHEREARKRQAHRASQRKGGRKQRALTGERADREFRYREAKRAVMRPSTGNAAAWSLRRTGVQVQRVPSTPEAADQALLATMQQMLAQHAAAESDGGQPHSSLTIVLVSDDAGFLPALRAAARRPGVQVALVSSREPSSAASDAALLSWVPWSDVLDLATRIHASGAPALDAAWGGKPVRHAPGGSDAPLASWDTVSLTSVWDANADGEHDEDDANVDFWSAGTPGPHEGLGDDVPRGPLGTVVDLNAPWRDPSTMDLASQLSAAMADVLPPEALDVLSDDGDDFGVMAQQFGDLDAAAGGDGSLTRVADSIADAAMQRAVQTAFEHARHRSGDTAQGRRFTTRGKRRGAGETQSR